MKVVRYVLAAPFGLVAFAFMCLASVFARLAMAVAGLGGRGPISWKVRL